MFSKVDMFKTKTETSGWRFAATHLRPAATKPDRFDGASGRFFPTKVLGSRLAPYLNTAAREILVSKTVSPSQETIAR